ncbi:HERV-H LTR-associating protein 1 [Centroberyx affinis]|uniref:HERV-H LTR-associating protein 1 n=1 Tax=Centroberyx affinis TaxID=166261 RepID=UPI003A5BF4DD
MHPPSAFSLEWRFPGPRRPGFPLPAPAVGLSLSLNTKAAEVPTDPSTLKTLIHSSCSLLFPEALGFSAMAASWRSRQHPPLCLIICAAAVLILVLFSQALRHRTQEERYRRDVLVSTEIPAEYIDPAAIDLTPLVNTLINSSQVGSRQLFSLLSVTSHSSLALHKLTLLVYNISSSRRIESNMFRRRYCYCVTNETNDLTDFTAILLDVMGNSTSYLQELFKSASILSVSQRNNSDCIFICVMAGQMQRDLPQLWEVDSITPLFNQTIIEGPHRDLAIWDERHANQQSPTDCTCFIYNCAWNSYNNTIDHRCPASSNNSSIYNLQTADSTQLTTTRLTRHPTTSTSQPTTRTSQPTTRTTCCGWLDRRAFEHENSNHNSHQDCGHRETRGCPWRKPELSDGSVSSSSTTVSAHKLQPCVLELCKFFSQCLCRPYSYKTRMKRYCDDSHLWYEKHTSEVCRRVRRVSFSRNLKQRCLARMCNKL